MVCSSGWRIFRAYFIKYNAKSSQITFSVLPNLSLKGYFVKDDLAFLLSYIVHGL